MQTAIWAITLLGLVAVAWAFTKSERTAVRLGVLAAFGAFYIGVLIWAPLDDLWFNVTTISLLVATFGSRLLSKSSPKGRSDSSSATGDEPPGGGRS